MNLEIPTDNAKARLEEFISEFQKLSEMDYGEGKKKRRELDTQVKTFLKMAFSDGGQKVKDYTPMYIGTTAPKSKKEKQNDYEENIGKKIEQLTAWKNNIEMLDELNESEKYNEGGSTKEKSESHEINIGNIGSFNGNFIQGNNNEINVEESFNQLKKQARDRNDSEIEEKIAQLEKELSKDEISKSKVKKTVSAIKNNASWAMPTLTTILLKVFGI